MTSFFQTKQSGKFLFPNFRELVKSFLNLDIFSSPPPFEPFHTIFNRANEGEEVSGHLVTLKTGGLDQIERGKHPHYKKLRILLVYLHTYPLSIPRIDGYNREWYLPNCTIL